MFPRLERPADQSLPIGIEDRYFVRLSHSQLFLYLDRRLLHQSHHRRLSVWILSRRRCRGNRETLAISQDGNWEATLVVHFSE